MQTMNYLQSDREVRALAACYRLLLQKAAERRARLATEAEKGAATAVSGNEILLNEAETKNAPK